MKSKLILQCVTVTAVCSITTEAYSGGFATAQFGGTHANAASDSLTSIFYNPAGLALGDGTRGYVEALGAYRHGAYTRNAADIDDPNPTPDAVDANSGAAKLSNFIAAPFAAMASDFGHRGLAIGLGVYVPFGGQADWSKVDKWKGNALFPGALDGPQRWAIVSGKQQSIFYTAAAAFRTTDNRLSFGGGLNVIQSAISLTRARNLSGTDDLLNSDGTVAEGRSLIDVSGIDVSLGMGVVAQVTPGLRIGVSYQSQPLGGGQSLTGTLTNKFGDAGVAQQKVAIRQRLPDSARLAVDWQRRRSAFRAQVDWTHWSLYRDQCLVDSTMPTTCEFLPSGAHDPMAAGSGPLLEIPRNWENGYGVQVGGSYWPKPNLEASASLRYDSNSVPDSTLEPALMDADKMIGMVGARLSRGRLDFDVTVAGVWYAKRTTSPRDGDLEPPSRNPDMAGTFEQYVLFALVGVGVHM
jgi:long-chain fatty acid transport protein